MYIKIKVNAGAKKESFEKISEDHFACSVKEKAERNMANGRVRELVALHFGVPTGKTKIISGHHSPSKIFSVDIDI
jgi:uncharacterized protein YggU (UPF0235/DUF167 family)